MSRTNRKAFLCRSSSLLPWVCSSQPIFSSNSPCLGPAAILVHIPYFFIVFLTVYRLCLMSIVPRAPYGYRKLRGCIYSSLFLYYTAVSFSFIFPDFILFLWLFYMHDLPYRYETKMTDCMDTDAGTNPDIIRASSEINLEPRGN